MRRSCQSWLLAVQINLHGPARWHFQSERPLLGSQGAGECLDGARVGEGLLAQLVARLLSLEHSLPLQPHPHVEIHLNATLEEKKCNAELTPVHCSISAPGIPILLGGSRSGTSDPEQDPTAGPATDTGAEMSNLTCSALEQFSIFRALLAKNLRNLP